MPNNQELNIQEQSAPNLPNQATPAPEGSNSDDSRGVYGALKCYFYTPKRGDIWGAFCLLFDGTTGDAMDSVFWVTRSLVGPAIDISAHWKSLNKLIPQMGTYERVLGDKLSVLMLDAFSSGVRIELCRSANHSEQLRDISDEVRNSFERATHCFLDLKMMFERISAQDLANAGVFMKDNAPAESENVKTQTAEKSFAGTLINCVPVIDPVHGKPISELKPDDMVEVKIQGGVGAGDLIHKYLTQTDQDAIFPVERVERNNTEKTYIFLRINEELKGLITSTKDIRLRVLDVKGQKKTPITINPDNAILFGVMVAAFVVIALVVRYLLF